MEGNGNEGPSDGDGDLLMASGRGPPAVRNLNMEGDSSSGAALMGKINEAGKDKGIREMKEVRSSQRKRDLS